MLYKTISIKCLLIISLLSIPSLLLADEGDYRFRTLSPKGGFYYDGVKEIVQDKEGVVWIMMDYDLFRFDGYEYKRYYTHFPGWEESSDWVFNNMVVDVRNRLYLGTNDGLYVYNKNEDSFERLTTKRTDYVQHDGHNNLWIKEDGKLGIFNPDTKEIIMPTLDGKIVPYLKSIHVNRNKEVYILSNYAKLFRCNPDTQEIIHCKTDNSTIEGLGYTTDALISKGNMWVLIADKGLYKINLRDFKIEKQYSPAICDNFNMRAIQMDKNGLIWIGSMNGIYILDEYTDQVTHYKHSPNNPFSLPDNSVWSLYEDWQQNIWIGTYSGGVSYVNLDERKLFKTYRAQKGQLSAHTVSSFAEDDKYLWIGTEGGGLNRQDKETNEFKHYLYHEKQNSVAFDNIKSMVKDNRGNLWIGTFTGGLDCLNTQTGYFTNYKKNNLPNSLYNNSIRKIVAESDSGLWIAYQNKKIVVSYLSYKDKSLKHYNITGNETNKYIFDILRERDNNLWMLTRKSLYKMDIKTHEMEKVIVGDSLILNGRAFCMDEVGNLWITTIGKGLIKYDTQTAETKIFNKILSMDVSAIYSICRDNDGALWLGTNNGLYRYDIINDRYTRYDENDGVQGTMFLPLAAYQGMNNKIYFGGSNGFTATDISKISINEYNAHVTISQILIDNKPVKSLNSVLNHHGKLELGHNQINFSFQFSSDNYLMPSKNKFKYKLEGYDTDWIFVDASHRLASYSKVPAGDYTLTIVAANNDGKWSNQPMHLKIIQKPAPWASPIAYSLYAILFAALTYSIYYYLTQKNKLKLKRYLDKVEKEKQLEIHKSQMNFFTNLSHDLKTPLSLIIGVIEKLRKEGLQEHYYRILNSSSKLLLNLVNELMDFRAFEKGKITLEVEKENVNSYVQQLGINFIDYAEQQGKHFEIKIDEKLTGNQYIDKYLVERMVMNLLDNAFKFTAEGATILLETYSNSKLFVSNYTNSYTEKNRDADEDYFSIVVRDTGIGISEESLAKVFERFYMAKNQINNIQGTGIGLSLVKNLALLHKAILTICSQQGKGTDVIISFPSQATRYTPEEIKRDYSNKQKENKKSETPPEIDLEEVIPVYKRKILLVEDNEDLRMLLKDELADDYEIIEAEDGLIATKIVKQIDVDLIISDIMMPNKDGIELCEELKNNIDTAHIPFIMLTAKTSMESKKEGVFAGADLYMEKPIDLGLLKTSVENIFKQKIALKEFFAKTHFAKNPKVSMNERDVEFMKQFVNVIENNIDKSSLDVNYIAAELSMSRSKLYNKIKKMTDRSIVEFILSYRLRKAARLIIEKDMTMREIITCIGIESQPYFTNAFKKEFGKTPTAFATEHKKTDKET